MTLSLFAFSGKLPQSFLLDAYVPDFMMCCLPAAHIYLLLAIPSLPCCVLNKLTRLNPKILLWTLQTLCEYADLSLDPSNSHKKISMVD